MMMYIGRYGIQYTMFWRMALTFCTQARSILVDTRAAICIDAEVALLGDEAARQVEVLDVHHFLGLDLILGTRRV